MDSDQGDARCRIPLPARLDTLEALRLTRALREGARNGEIVTVDASGIEDIGLAAIQLLAVASIVLGQDGKTLVVADASAACRAGIADAGMDDLLFGKASASALPPSGRTRIIAFADAALDYGREPLEGLHQLRLLGIKVMPILPDALPPLEAIEADHMLLRFQLVLPDAVADEQVRDALAEYGDTVLLAGPGAAAVPPAAVGSDHPSPEQSIPPQDGVSRKLALLAADIEELIARQGALTERFGSLDRGLASELAAIDGLLRTVQEHAMAAGLAPVGQLLQPLQLSLPGSIPAHFPGAELEIERAVIERLIPALSALLRKAAGPRAAPPSPSAREAEGLLQLDFPLTVPPALPPDDLIEAAKSVRGRVGLVEADAGTILRIELPRTVSMLEALIMRVGAQYAAIEVGRVIEILQPDPRDMGAVGPGSTLLRFRDSYVPVIQLSSQLNPGQPDIAAQAGVIVVVQSTAGDFGLMVSEVTDHRQIVVKPLDDNLAVMPAVIGVSFVQRGGIALVVDPEKLRALVLSGA